ncbi:DUF2970 domain-containing protein [Aestuariibacter sp. A3R04]|uniref:DUF2970 domain-containing protein n=1 Tax=Aestuariibacter sp. A3R04 TaxID=2841571 RepID=UPI001C0860F4|nr:DUF2970 domain-containing protein [Aestuariibacter sp. A3R04]MBU3020795.1 DUF2970 domain-containing protein [Aestuariibacter sp. A3R04]
MIRLSVIEHKSSPGLWSMMLSVLASAFGVQSHSNYERDFNHGKVASYVVMGVVFVALLVITLALIVKLILA